MTVGIVLLVAAAVAAVVAVALLRNRSAANSVDSFRRHIDALGPEARRTVVDQVQRAAVEENSDPPDDDQPGGDAESGDEGGARGT